MPDFEKIKKLCRLIRYDILTSTTAAQSGHATSSLSAVELMTTLFFGGFLTYDLEQPENPANDRVIFSKGHASPLLYSLYHAAGAITYEELMTLRQFNSTLEGHPTPKFKYVDVATGSLGQGLSIGVGMALGIKLKTQNSNVKTEVQIATGVSSQGSQSSFAKATEGQSSAGGLTTEASAKLVKDERQAPSLEPKVFVLLGDSEMAEGQVWEAMEIASYYKLNNLIAIVDVNRLGQRGETILGWDLGTYAKRAEAFGWEAIVLDDGNDIEKVYYAFKNAIGVASDETLREADLRSEGKSLAEEKSHERQNLSQSQSKPKIIIARTIKGKGVSFLENKNGWHGKAVPKDQLESALKELGELDLNIRGEIMPPQFQISNFKFQNDISKIKNSNQQLTINYQLGEQISTRQAYGDALVYLGEIDSSIIVLDPEISNSTYAEKFREKFPDRFFEVFIAEQNAISMAVGLERMGFIPYLATFSAFFSRAFDQLRMAQYSVDAYHLDNDRGLDGNGPNLKLVGTHSGVYVGQDGPSQIGLEDISLMRSLLNSTVLYPADALSAFKLILEMHHHTGISYLRTTRNPTPIIYKPEEEFKIGGSKILRQSPNDKAVVFAAGITVHEALKAYEELKKEQISLCVVDLYSIKPIDHATIQQFAMKVKNIIVVEDHYPYGGLGEAVLSSLHTNSVMLNSFQHLDSKNQIPKQVRDDSEKNGVNFIHLAVNKLPRSGSPEELLHFEEIDAEAIVKKVKNLSSVNPQG